MSYRGSIFVCPGRLLLCLQLFWIRNDKNKTLTEEQLTKLTHDVNLNYKISSSIKFCTENSGVQKVQHASAKKSRLRSAHNESEGSETKAVLSWNQIKSFIQFPYGLSAKNNEKCVRCLRPLKLVVK